MITIAMGNSIKVISDKPLRVNIKYFDMDHNKEPIQEIILLTGCTPKQQGNKLIFNYANDTIKVITYETAKDACSAYNELLKIFSKHNN